MTSVCVIWQLNLQRAACKPAGTNCNLIDMAFHTLNRCSKHIKRCGRMSLFDPGISTDEMPRYCTETQAATALSFVKHLLHQHN